MAATTDPRPGAIHWFEIPVADIDRAISFYATVLGCEFTIDDETGESYPMLTGPDGEAFGALTLEGEHPVGEDEPPVRYTTAETGVLIYLTVDGNLDGILESVEPAGGEVRVGKQRAPDGATYAIITDSEGNRIGLMRPT